MAVMPPPAFTMMICELWGDEIPLAEGQVFGWYLLHSPKFPAAELYVHDEDWMSGPRTPKDVKLK